MQFSQTWGRHFSMKCISQIEDKTISKTHKALKFDYNFLLPLFTKQWVNCPLPPQKKIKLKEIYNENKNKKCFQKLIWQLFRNSISFFEWKYQRKSQQLDFKGKNAKSWINFRESMAIRPRVEFSPWTNEN